MKRSQTGFTMIELIVVIVILGILAATALPKFVDLRSDAVASAGNGMAGQLGSAMSINYAGCQAVNNSTAGANAAKCTTINNCSQAATLLTGGAFPTNGTTTFSVAAASLTTTNGSTANCTLTATNGTTTATSTFTGVAAGN